MNNQVNIQIYLDFEGKCEEAIAFYSRTLGAKLLFQMRYKDSPEPPPPGCAPPDANKIMHAQMQIGNSVVMASDGQCKGGPKFEGFCLSCTVETEAEVDRVFNALAEGGQVLMPPAKMFFSARFGMVSDKFGIKWMVLVRPADVGAERKCDMGAAA